MAWAIGFFLGIQKEARRRGGEIPCDERSNPIIAPSSVWPSASHLPPRGKAYKEQAAKQPSKNLNFHRRSVPEHLPDTLLRLAPGEHDLPAASLAAELEVHTHPEDEPLLAAAGVAFFIFSTSFTWISMKLTPPPF